MNRKRVGEVECKLSWSPHEVLVGDRFTQRGMNEITIEWPYPIVKKEDVWGEVIGRLEQGLETTIHPVFGEIERFCIQKRAKSN